MGELADKLRSVGGFATTPCPVGKLLSEMDEDTRTAMESALQSRAATRAIHNELISSGIRIGRDTLSAHRNGWCRCAVVKQ